MKRVFYSTVLSLLVCTQVFAASMYWKSSLSELNGISGVTNTDRAVVMDSDNNATFYSHASGSWAKMGVNVTDIITKGPWVDVRAYGAVGDGTTDDTAAFTAALAVGNPINVPTGTYKITSTLTFPANANMVGAGRTNTILVKTFNGDFATLGEEVHISNISFNGNGATYTGKGLVMTGTNGRQHVLHSKIYDTEDYPISFDNVQAGSQSVWDDLKIYAYNGVVNGKHAVYIPNVLQAAGNPRHFNNIETDGTKFIDLGGCNGLFITNSYVGGITFRSESRGVEISGSRIGVNETAMMTIYGYNHAMSGNNFGPSVTIMPGAQEVTIIGNTYNGSVYDNSAFKRNMVEIHSRTYTPTLTSPGAAPAVGNAINRGIYTRIGNIITLCIEFAFGSTTDFGSGTVKWSVPGEVAPLSSYQQAFTGMATIIDASPSNVYLSAMALVPADNTISFYLDNTADQVSATSPITWADNDVLRGCVSYVRGDDI